MEHASSALLSASFSEKKIEKYIIKIKNWSMLGLLEHDRFDSNTIIILLESPCL